jgi:hypothetical protein
MSNTCVQLIRLNAHSKQFSICEDGRRPAKTADPPDKRRRPAAGNGRALFVGMGCCSLYKIRYRIGSDKHGASIMNTGMNWNRGKPCKPTQLPGVRIRKDDLGRRARGGYDAWKAGLSIKQRKKLRSAPAR